MASCRCTPTTSPSTSRRRSPKLRGWWWTSSRHQHPATAATSPPRSTTNHRSPDGSRSPTGPRRPVCPGRAPTRCSSWRRRPHRAYRGAAVQRALLERTQPVLGTGRRPGTPQGRPARRDPERGPGRAGTALGAALRPPGQWRLDRPGGRLVRGQGAADAPVARGRRRSRPRAGTGPADRGGPPTWGRSTKGASPRGTTPRSSRTPSRGRRSRRSPTSGARSSSGRWPRHSWSLVHVLATGGRSRQGKLALLLSPPMNPDIVTVPDFVEDLQKADELPRLVVLAACESDLFAAELARTVPNVIGMRGTISDEGCLAFLRGLYKALGSGSTIDQAVAGGSRSAARLLPRLGGRVGPAGSLPHRSHSARQRPARRSRGASGADASHAFRQRGGRSGPGPAR